MKQKLLKWFDTENINEGFAKILIAISAYETGYWSSRLCRRNKNFFGMKQPRIRETTSLGEWGGYASYENKRSSVRDMVMYLRYFDYNRDYTNLEMFVQEMQIKGYYEQDFGTYYKGVKACYEKLWGTGK